VTITAKGCIAGRTNCWQFQLGLRHMLKFCPLQLSMPLLPLLFFPSRHTRYSFILHPSETHLHSHAHPRSHSSIYANSGHLVWNEIYAFFACSHAPLDMEARRRCEHRKLMEKDTIRTLGTGDLSSSPSPHKLRSSHTNKINLLCITS